jgi:hypothetical protein
MRYFSGNTLASFYRSSSVIVESNTAGRFEAVNLQNSIAMTTSTHLLDTIPFAIPVSTEFFTFFDVYLGGISETNYPLVKMYTASGSRFEIFPKSLGAGPNVCFRYWNTVTSAWVESAQFVIGATILTRLCIYINRTTGAYAVRQGGIDLVSGVMVNWNNSESIINHRFSTMGPSGTVNLSRVLIADYDCTDDIYVQLPLTGNSAINNGQLSGAFGDVNETVLSDTTLINIATAAAKAGQTKTAVTVPVGYKVGAMVTSMRSRVGAPRTDGKLGIRSGGTNYSSAGLGVGPTFKPKQVINELDPATGAAWATAAFNAAEIYQEAV